MRSGVPPDAGKAQESFLEAVVVILAGCGRKVRRSAAVYGASTVSAAFGM